MFPKSPSEKKVFVLSRSKKSIDRAKAKEREEREKRDLEGQSSVAGFFSFDPSSQSSCADTHGRSIQENSNPDQKIRRQVALTKVNKQP